MGLDLGFGGEQGGLRRGKSSPQPVGTKFGTDNLLVKQTNGQAFFPSGLSALAGGGAGTPVLALPLSISETLWQ